MIVLGLNAHGHDAAAVLLVNGAVAFAASEERFDRVRHSTAFPARAVAEALRATGTDPADVDAVAFPWTRGMARGRKALHVLTHLPRSLAYLREPPDALLPSRAGYLRAMRRLEQDVAALGIAAPVRRVPHHVAHAASACLAAPFDTCAVLVLDGRGERGSVLAGRWHRSACRSPRATRDHQQNLNDVRDLRAHAATLGEHRYARWTGVTQSVSGRSRRGR